MGNKCGKNAEVGTLSRRNSKTDIVLGPVEAQMLKKAKKKKEKKSRRQKLKNKLKRQKKSLKNAKGINQIPIEYQSGAAWRIRTHSESSIQSDTSYYDAEDDELSLTEDDSIILGGAEPVPNYLSFWPFGSYILNKFFGQDLDPSQAHHQGSHNRNGIAPDHNGGGGGVATNWDVRLRSQSKASRQLDRAKAESGKLLKKALVPHEVSAERGMESERHCWDQPPGEMFPLRGQNYLKDRKKIRSKTQPLYTLKSVDFYRSDFKVDHIAQRLKLPSTEKIPEDCPVSPLLVVNWQAPMYQPKLFNKAGDGEGLNVVAIFSLRDGFVAEEEIEQGRLYPHTFELLKRFCGNKLEEDNSLSRERLKMIPAMPNLEEWCSSGTFGRTEQAILRKWQNKPMLVRPQYKVFAGPEYIEIDINIHDYQYATRRYFHALRHALQFGVMDMALTLEGRCFEQLPEQVIASIRLQKIDFLQSFPTVPPLPPIRL